MWQEDFQNYVEITPYSVLFARCDDGMIKNELSGACEKCGEMKHSYI
jgi:hypothetical protein